MRFLLISLAIACHPSLAYEIGAQGRSLAEVLVADARGGDALPLLQMTLQRLFDAEAIRADGVLRFADYPGMDAAVAPHQTWQFPGAEIASDFMLARRLSQAISGLSLDCTAHQREHQ